MQSVSNEDELITRFIRRQSWSGFSKVTQISTVKISPDIDFLQIDNLSKQTQGYEFKLIRYNKRWKKANLMPMYTGLGEALHYFQFGIDKSHLVLGLSNTIPEDALYVALEKVKELTLTLSIFDLMGVGCLGVHLWYERNDNVETLLHAPKNFRMSGDIEHLKKCLLRRQFRYEKQYGIGFEVTK